MSNVGREYMRKLLRQRNEELADRWAKIGLKERARELAEVEAYNYGGSVTDVERA